MLLADEIKYLVAIYWRFQRQHYLVSTEYDGADVISVSEHGTLVCETEVKISIADLKKERQKPKHTKDAFGTKLYRPGYGYVHEYYFAMPERMAELDQVKLICDGRFPYAGILAVGDYEDYLKREDGCYLPPPVSCVKKSQRLVPANLDNNKIMDIARRMSNSYCNLAFKLMRLERGYITQKRD